MKNSFANRWIPNELCYTNYCCLPVNNNNKLDEDDKGFFDNLNGLLVAVINENLKRLFCSREIFQKSMPIIKLFVNIIDYSNKRALLIPEIIKDKIKEIFKFDPKSYPSLETEEDYLNLYSLGLFEFPYLETKTFYNI